MQRHLRLGLILLTSTACADDSTGVTAGGTSGDSTTGSVGTTSGTTSPTIPISESAEGSGSESGGSTDGGSTGGGSTDGGSTDGGSTTGGEPETGTTSGVCDPSASPSEDACVIDDAYGVFVALEGDDAGAGTMADPFRTISHALTVSAVPGRIYVCGQDFGLETLGIPAGVSIYGGLDCNADWAWTGTRTSIAGDAIAARVTGNGFTVIEDLNITAANASTPGGSSIALLVTDAEVSVRRSDLTAGMASAGTTAADVVTTGDDGPDGGSGDSMYCNNMTAASGAAEVPNPSCATSVGGAGGSGGWSSGALAAGGSPGQPVLTGGPGGNGGSCSVGMPGSAGATGGGGTPGTGGGSLTVDGYVGADGGAGLAGDPGGGGGGGGGGPWINAIPCNIVWLGVGSGGGSGGAGGCGGDGAPGGTAGGSSIALAGVAATLDLAAVRLATSTGGQGGGGGAGGGGGDGGDAGTGFGGGSPSCDGGAGADGGTGGGGGGGQGGHSVGVAYDGLAPTLGDGVTFSTSTAGAGGAGGGGDASLDGDAGTAADTLQL